MTRPERWLIVALCALAAACKDDPDRGKLIDAAAGKTTPDPNAPPGTTSAADSAIAQAGSEATTVNFAPVGGSGVSGDVTLQANGDLTRVQVVVNGAKGTGVMHGHIHSGTCANIGAVVAPLSDVTTNDQGSGTSSTTAEVPMRDLFDGNHLVSYHELNGNPGSPVACAALPKS